jgi:hypothetical protein
LLRVLAPASFWDAQSLAIRPTYTTESYLDVPPTAAAALN